MNLLAECFKIIDPYTAHQIRLAATRAHWGEVEQTDAYDEWAEEARKNAGYGGC